jgi:hypothetical protein
MNEFIHHALTSLSARRRRLLSLCCMRTLMRSTLRRIRTLIHSGKLTARRLGRTLWIDTLEHPGCVKRVQNPQAARRMSRPLVSDSHGELTSGPLHLGFTLALTWVTPCRGDARKRWMGRDLGHSESNSCAARCEYIEFHGLLA